MNFTGDGFVKSNVILRLLTAEAEHVRLYEAITVKFTGLNSRRAGSGVAAGQLEQARCVFSGKLASDRGDTE